MGLSGILGWALLAMPDAHATACDAAGNDFVNCERTGRAATVADYVGPSYATSDVLDGYTCGTSSAQANPERIHRFSCATTSLATVRLQNTSCDLDVFVLSDECNPADNAETLGCNTAPYSAAADRYDVQFVCEAGRTYYIVIEAWAVDQTFISPACPLIPTPAGNRKGSNYQILGICTEVCTDGFDNDRDGQTDCNDIVDCGAAPACNQQPEDCDTVGDEDGDGKSDCADPDCLGADACCDVDADGARADTPACGNGPDCDDSDPDVGPGERESVADGIDQDCDGVDDCWRDFDGDGYGGTEVVPGVDLDCDAAGESVVNTDCDDQRDFVAPDAPELVASGRDEDCDGRELCPRDVDRDGYGGLDTVVSTDLVCGNVVGEAPSAGDCADDDAERFPTNPELVADGVDQDCVGGDLCWRDADRDGFGGTGTRASADLDCTDAQESLRSDDCDDTVVTVFPGATEVPYDGVDQDCSGADLVDRDSDGAAGGGGPDCNDLDAAIGPGAVEIVADGIDQDCDTRDTCWLDADGDGRGVAVRTPGDDLDCADGPGTASNTTDCNDADAAAYPGATEVPYDGIDQDCSGADLDDVDGDGVKGGTGGLDCNDARAAVKPGATELANGVDDDCDGEVDEGTTGFDDDGDGYAEAGGDCDDTRASVRPGGSEVPNSVDDDCDGVSDEGTTFYDDDGDGLTELEGDCNDGDPLVYPGATEPVGAGVDRNCDGLLVGGENDGDGYTARGGDCDDSDDTVFPGATEIANGRDDDCDERTDEGTAVVDDDGDGATEAQGDCNDADPLVGPAAIENPGNFRDDDCDGVVDEGGRHVDDDGDGFTEAEGDCDDGDRVIAPYQPERDNDVDDDCDGAVDERIGDADADGFTFAQGDCDDGNGWVNPERPELCGDAVDNDCDEKIDEGCEAEVLPPDDAPETTGCGCDGTGGGGLGLGLLGVLLRRRRARARG